MAQTKPRHNEKPHCNEKPRYSETPDGIFIYKIENQIFKVGVFFNQNAVETLQDKLLRVILADQSKQAKGGVIYG